MNDFDEKSYQYKKVAKRIILFVNPVPVFSDVMVATVATSHCIVRPAASQVFLPILDC